MYRGKSKKKNFKYEKKGSSRPFSAHSAGGQETTFYLRVASGEKCVLPEDEVIADEADKTVEQRVED